MLGSCLRLYRRYCAGVDTHSIAAPLFCVGSRYDPLDWLPRIQERNGYT